MNVQKIENIMLIGLGYHARRIYFPVLYELQQKKIIGKIFIVDLKNQEKVILDYLNEKKNCEYELLLLDKPENKKLSKTTKRDLDNIVDKGKIKGVIISTEPLAHMVYARWALNNRLSILMDKPISTHMWISTNVKMGKKLISDY
jgi:predicted dehydrogenase